MLVSYINIEYSTLIWLITSSTSGSPSQPVHLIVRLSMRIEDNSRITPCPRFIFLRHYVSHVVS